MLSGCYSVDLRTIGKSINGPRIARRWLANRSGADGSMMNQYRAKYTF